MTLIILQVMHSSLYTSVDDKLHGLSNNPQAVIQLAVNRATEEIKDLENAATDTSKTEVKTPMSVPIPRLFFLIRILPSFFLETDFWDWIRLS